eukprot:7389975-Prymnesium_polylepis.1
MVTVVVVSKLTFSATSPVKGKWPPTESAQEVVGVKETEWSPDPKESRSNSEMAICWPTYTTVVDS